MGFAAAAFFFGAALGVDFLVAVAFLVVGDFLVALAEETTGVEAEAGAGAGDADALEDIVG